MAADGRNHWDDGPRIELRGDPAYRYREEQEDPGAFLDPEEERPRPRRRLGGPLRFALAGLLLIGFGGLVLYAYSWGSRDPAPGELPLVAAPEGPEKERPESPGGLEVPYQDTLVLNPGRDPGEGVERLLPPPEEPLPPEAEPRPAEQTATPQPEPAPEEEAPAAAEATPDEAIEVGEIPTPTVSEPALPPPPTPAPTPAEPQAQPQAPAAQEPPAPAPAQPEQQAAQPSPAAGGGFLVQLASVSNQEAAQREWGRMQARHPQQLGSLTLNVERADLGERGIFFRIQAGPLASREAANSLCAQLRAQQQDCLVRAR